MGKGPVYGEFSFPKGEMVHVRAYSRGGKVSQPKVEKVMHEFGQGALHSGSKKGPVVKSHDQAVAIAMSEGRKAAKGMACGGTAKGYAKGGAVKPMKAPKSAQAPMTPPMGMAGGMSQKPAPTMQPRAPKKPMMGAAPGGMGMKSGGAVGKMPNLNPKASVHTTPKKMNVKSRLSAGTTPTEMKQGGLTHADVAMDKTLIKKAIKMHDDQLHGGKDTHLKSLRKGGLAACCK